MPKYAVYFSRSYAFEVEAKDAEHAQDVAHAQFNGDEANAASEWQMENFVDKLED